MSVLLLQSARENRCFTDLKTSPSTEWVDLILKKPACKVPTIGLVLGVYSPVNGFQASRGGRFSQRHSRRRLDTIEYKTGFAVLHAGVFEQGVHDEAAVVGHVGHHDAQQIVHFAGG